MFFDHLNTRTYIVTEKKKKMHMTERGVIFSILDSDGEYRAVKLNSEEMKLYTSIPLCHLIISKTENVGNFLIYMLC